MIAALADEQHGVVARRQLLAAGVRASAIDRRVGRGILVALHRGVYAVGHARLTQDGFWLAAVLAVGPGAMLSHRSAAARHELGGWSNGRIEITSPRRAGPLPGLTIYARRRLPAADVTVVAAVPVTSVARTLVDLADVLAPARLSHALSEAERKLLIDPAELSAAAARLAHRRGPGPSRLRAVLAEQKRRGTTLTRSELEIAFRSLVRRHQLPEPKLNAWIAGAEVDAVWPDARLAVECDGWAFHRGRRAFQRDRDKTNALQLRGWRVLRFTHADVIHRPEQVAAAIHSAIVRSLALRRRISTTERR